jgi:hypothetical protein
MSQRRLTLKITVGAIVAIVLIGLIAVFTPIRIQRGLSPEAWERKLPQEIPVGSSYGFVLSYLDKAGIEHSPLMPKDRKVYAIIRDTCWAAMLQCSTDMKFLLEASGGPDFQASLSKRDLPAYSAGRCVKFGNTTTTSEITTQQRGAIYEAIRLG